MSSIDHKKRSKSDEPPKENSLYVSDIARGVNDEDLKEAFGKIANVYDALIVKNKFSGETKGYGFVRFFSMDDVYTVLDCETLPKFEDSVSHKVQTVRVTIADAKDTLFIGNIPRGWTEEQVIDKLTEVGQEAPVKFKFSERNTQGYASYEDHETAVLVLKNIQRPTPGSSTAPFMAHLAPPKFGDGKAPLSMRVLFVRGVAGIQRDDIRELFGGAEVVSRVTLPLDNATGAALGHAYIHFTSIKEAAHAIERLNNTEYEGHQLSVEWSRVSKRDAPSLPSHPYSHHAPPASDSYHPYPFPFPYGHYYPEYYPPYPYLPYEQLPPPHKSSSYRERSAGRGGREKKMHTPSPPTIPSSMTAPPPPTHSAMPPSYMRDSYPGYPPAADMYSTPDTAYPPYPSPYNSYYGYPPPSSEASGSGGRGSKSYSKSSRFIPY